MFGRGSWAIFGIRAASQAAFELALSATSAQAVMVSQVEAVRLAMEKRIPTIGINPYLNPREDIESGENPVGSTEDFRLGPQQFGLWLCLNGEEDLSDPKSKQEDIAYSVEEKPFKFLKKEEKQNVDASVKASAVASRKQFPVLIDFVGERVYALTTDIEEIETLRRLLSELQAEPFDLAWNFGDTNWPSKFLNVIWEENKFAGAMESRADELCRFKKEEIEKLEDRVLENIVSNYFSMAELPTGHWAGLSVPARIKFFHGAEPSSESSVSTAYTLKAMMEESEIVSAAVTFQSLELYIKKDEEKQRRTDLFTIDINDKINISDAGAAALRGFDLSQFKRDMKIRAKNGDLHIADYWLDWLIGMKNAVNMFADEVRETLQVDKNLGLIPYDQFSEKVEANATT